MIVGTDIAELLLRNGENSDGDDSLSASGIDHRAQSTPSPAPSAGSRTSSASATGVASVMNSSSVQQTKLSESEITNKFREFLLYGSTKEALGKFLSHSIELNLCREVVIIVSSTFFMLHLQNGP